MLPGIPNLEIDEDALRAFCEEWGVAELAVFGSVLRDDFTPESDVDFLVTFRPGERWTVTDLVRMERALAEMLGREVDLVERAAVEENPDPRVRREILGNARLLRVA
ncbi:MAG: nucleotidyltransferase [Anaerolinea sp.]|nr:nucleotidyltransferase [Anaerolinea sp.]